MDKSKQNMGVTGLRGILVLMTALGCHYSFLFGTVPASSNLGKRLFDICYTLGLTAPNAFLVMSGYFMYHKYRQPLKQGLGFKNYLFPKIKKIYPLMFFTTIYLFALENIGKWKLGFYPLHGGGGELRFSLPALVASLFGVQSGFFAEGDTMSVNGPSWFVTVLILCYLVFFVIIKLCNNKKTEWGCYVLLVVVGAIFTFHPLPFPLLYETSARGFLFFFEGCLLHIAMDMAYHRKTISLLRLSALILMLLGIVMTLLQGNFLLWQVLLWPCLLYFILTFEPLERFFSFPPFVWAGTRSMSLFLGNLPVLTTFSWLNLWYEWHVDYGIWPVWIIIAILNLMAGQIMYAVFECRIPKLARRKNEK